MRRLAPFRRPYRRAYATAVVLSVLGQVLVAAGGGGAALWSAFAEAGRLAALT